MSKALRNAFDSRYIKRSDARAMLLASGWRKNGKHLWEQPVLGTWAAYYLAEHTLRQALEIHHKNTEEQAA
jgi:hypothetical protein